MRFIRNVVMGQVRLLVAIARLLTRRKAVPVDGWSFSFGKTDRQMLAIIVPLTILEAAVVGLLFHGFAAMRYIDIAQWWMAVAMLGLYAAAVVYPHVVTPTEIRLRARRGIVALPLVHVRDVRWNPLRSAPDDGSLFLATKDGTELTFTLEPPLQVDGGSYQTVHAAADDQAVVERLRGCLASAHE